MELDETLHKAIDAASKELGESKATIMRLAIRAGLPDARAALLRLGKGAGYGEHKPDNLMLNMSTGTTDEASAKKIRKLRPGQDRKSKPAEEGGACSI